MSLKKIFIGLLLTGIIFIAYYFLLSRQFGNLAERGQFGDMFGAVNAFFTALAFLGLVYTIVQQNEVIQKTTDQLDQNKKEFAVQQKIQGLTMLVKVYERKLSQAKNQMDISELQKKINDLTSELEKFLLK